MHIHRRQRALGQNHVLRLLGNFTMFRFIILLKAGIFLKILLQEIPCTFPNYGNVSKA